MVHRPVARVIDSALLHTQVTPTITQQAAVAIVAPGPSATPTGGEIATDVAKKPHERLLRATCEVCFRGFRSRGVIFV